jgi:hypothetical protein
MSKIQILTYQKNPRVRYAIDLVFRRILGLECAVVSPGDRVPGQASHIQIWYDNEAPTGALSLPNSKFLQRTDAIPFAPPIVEGSIPLLFPEEGNFLLPFDLFAAVFFLATDFPQSDPMPTDNHGRIMESLTPLGAAGFYDQPLIHLWCEMLREKLNLPKVIRPFDWEITVDVDNPWKHQHKPAGVTLGGLAKAALSGKFGEVKERFTSLTSDKDPFDTYDEFIELAGDKLRFFFLVGGDSPHDSRFNLSQLPLKELIIRLAREKHVKTGVHPSYKSSDDEEMMREEITALRMITPVTHSRQHYLRLRTPATYRNLIREDITDDYSICRITDTGFRTGMCVTYPWFDLEANEETKLMLHPAAAMDRTLQQYKQKDAAAALTELIHRAEQVRKVNGCFVVILHNETISESGEWKGWKATVRTLIETLKQFSNESHLDQRF